MKVLDAFNRIALAGMDSLLRPSVEDVGLVRGFITQYDVAKRIVAIESLAPDPIQPSDHIQPSDGEDHYVASSGPAEPLDSPADGRRLLFPESTPEDWGTWKGKVPPKVKKIGRHYYAYVPGSRSPVGPFGTFGEGCEFLLNYSSG